MHSLNAKERKIIRYLLPFSQKAFERLNVEIKANLNGKIKKKLLNTLLYTVKNYLH